MLLLATNNHHVTGRTMNVPVRYYIVSEYH